MQKCFNKLLKWSQQFSHLPWRQNRTTYRTLVSEIMLQQTTVTTVLNKFEVFLNQYPSISQLAKSTEEEILIAWKGLGYYRRAKNLLAAAQYINEYYNAEIPNDYDALVAIPGIGDYTARAILSIALEQRYLAVDTNIERVVARYYAIDENKGTELKNKIQQLFEQKEIFNLKKSYGALNEALMDLGRENCTTRKTDCPFCPLQATCQSVNNPLARPISTTKIIEKYHISLLRVLIIEQDMLWSYKKEEGEWLAGQWECPTFLLESEDKKLQQYPRVVFDKKNLHKFKSTITKYKITNYVLKLSLQEFKKLFQWKRVLEQVPMGEQSNFSTSTLKALSKIENV